jgi:hypothetical protein
MDTKKLVDLVDRDFPESGPVTSEARDAAKKLAGRFRGSVRVSTGRFWTDEEYQRHRAAVLRTPLP